MNTLFAFTIWLSGAIAAWYILGTTVLFPKNHKTGDEFMDNATILIRGIMCCMSWAMFLFIGICKIITGDIGQDW